MLYPYFLFAEKFVVLGLLYLPGPYLEDIDLRVSIDLHNDVSMPKKTIFKIKSRGRLEVKEVMRQKHPLNCYKLFEKNQH